MTTYDEMRKQKMESVRGAAIVLATLLVIAGFAFTLFCNFQAAIGPDSEYSLGWFNSTIANLSAKYPSPITPASYAFSIWGLIYVWTAVWLVYVASTLVRCGAKGPVYLHPPVLSLPFLLSVFVGNGLNVLWLFVWDRELLVASAALLLLSALVLVLALATIASRVYMFLPVLQHWARFDLFAYRVLVCNGVAIYTAWVIIASQVALSVSLLYDVGLPSDTTTYICLSILAAELLAYLLCDLVALAGPLRPVFAVYPVFIWALVAVVMQAAAEDINSPQFIFSAVLLGVSSVCFCVKLVLACVAPPPGYKSLKV